ANHVTGTWSGRVSQLRGAAATSTVRALDADTEPGSVSERDVGGSLRTAWWLPERMLKRSTGAANESLMGEPAGTSSQRLLIRAFGVRTVRCSRKVRPSTQLTGAERVI